MVPITLKRQLKAWATVKASTKLLELAFSASLSDAQNACKTLGGVEFSEISEDLQNYALGIENTLEACAHKILKHFSENVTLERCGTNHAKYGEKTIVLKGGDSQFEAMKSAEIFLKEILSGVLTIKTDPIETTQDWRDWLEREFSGVSLENKLENLENAALNFLPLAQRLERKNVEATISNDVHLHTCLWNSVEAETPFTIKDEKDNVLAEDTLLASIGEFWPARLIVSVGDSPLILE